MSQWPLVLLGRPVHLAAEKNKCNNRKLPRVRRAVMHVPSRLACIIVRLSSLTPYILHALVGGGGPEQLLYGQAPVKDGDEVFKGSVVTSEAGNSVMMV
jgi:hypothetical protein